MHLLIFEPPSLCRLCFFRFRTSRASYAPLRAERAFSEGFFGFGDFFLFFFLASWMQFFCGAASKAWCI
jgi:hypothetical protein